MFRADTNAVYEGLHVLDGAIVPGALGINPFLTISALSWRACDAIAQELHLEESGAPLEKLPPTRVLAPRTESDEAPVIVRERLVGRLDDTDSGKKKRLIAKFPDAARWFDTDGLILEVETEGDDTAALIDGSGARKKTGFSLWLDSRGQLPRRRCCSKDEHDGLRSGASGDGAWGARASACWTYLFGTVPRTPHRAGRSSDS